MNQVLKPYATLGVAIVGAGLIVAPTVVAPHTAGTARDVALTAADGFTGAINTASDSLSTLINAYYLAPGIVFQQAMHNLAGYIQQVNDDPASITEVTRDLQHDIKSALSALTLMNADGDTVNEVIRHTMDGSQLGGHSLIFGQIPGFLPAEQADAATPIINYLASPMSGLLIGTLGPTIAPMVAFGNTMQDALDAFQAGDSATGMGELAAIPANMFDASLNGATLNLDALLPMIADSGMLPGAMEITHLEFAFGGLFSTGGHVTADPFNLVDGDGDKIGESVPAVGGSIFNSLGVHISGVPILGELDLQSDAVGPIGALLGLSHVIAAQLGWGTSDGKSGWDVPALPPGADVQLPDNFADSFIDDGGADNAAAAASAGALQALLDAMNA